jgi:hypothetical protein
MEPDLKRTELDGIGLKRPKLGDKNTWSTLVVVTFNGQQVKSTLTEC